MVHAYPTTGEDCNFKVTDENFAEIAWSIEMQGVITECVTVNH